MHALSCFKLTKHPRVAPHYAQMKEELTKYNALVKCIKTKDQRLKRNRKGEMIDTFDRRAWWVNVKEKLPHFFAVLRAVLTHAPNSCPPERVFSILNDTFDNDQTRAYADYIETSLRLQYNKRTRK